MKHLVYIVLLCCGSLSAQDKYGEIRKLVAVGNTSIAYRLLDSVGVVDKVTDSVLYYSALCALHDNDWKKAKAFTTKLNKQFADFGETEFLIGMVHYIREDYGRCTEAFNRLLKKNPTHYKALFNRAMAFGKAGNYNFAIEDLTAYIKLRPEDANAYYARAYWLEFMEQYKESVADYEKAIQLHPKNFDAYIGLAFCWSKLNDRSKACEAIERSIQEGSQIGTDLKNIYCR